jgi:hypothetical protein
MAVVSVSSGGISADYWKSEKPEDYKGTELDKALAAWSGLASKKVDIPKDLIPSPPECKVGALEKYNKSLDGVLKELDKAKELVNKYITCLKAVQGAGSKAAGDITKMSTVKGVSEEAKQKYVRAAGAASSIASSAASELKKYE